jgi:hypothetical protein
MENISLKEQSGQPNTLYLFRPLFVKLYNPMSSSPPFVDDGDSKLLLIVIEWMGKNDHIKELAQ